MLQFSSLHSRVPSQNYTQSQPQHVPHNADRGSFIYRHSARRTRILLPIIVHSSSRDAAGNHQRGYEVFEIPDSQGVDLRYLSRDEALDRVAAAAEFIELFHKLRPINPKKFNGFYEIYKRIAAIPEEFRVRLIDELSPGAVRTLWKQSLARYVLDEERSKEVLVGNEFWSDFPQEDGEVITYSCRSERLVLTASPEPFKLVQRAPGSSGPAMLTAQPGKSAFPVKHFSIDMFLHPRTRQHYGLVVVGRRWSWVRLLFRVPLYCRLQPGPHLTPVPEDAGADATLVFHDSPTQPLDLTPDDLPNPRWPAPRLQVTWSPLSRTGRDFIRPIGPGVYVGCAYRREGKGNVYDDEDFVHFLMVREY